MPLETDVEEFVRRVDTIVSDTQVETRPGTGIIEEVVDFPPGEFVIERGRLGIQTRNTKTTSLPCSVPKIVCDSIQAGKSKCGYSEFGTPSSPPKVYLKKVYAGEHSDTGCCPAHPTPPPGGATGASFGHADRTYSFDPLHCELGESVDHPANIYDAVHNYRYSVFCFDGSHTTPGTQGEYTGAYTVVSTTFEEQTFGGPTSINCSDGTPCSSANCKSINNYASFTLTDEYDTETLKQNVRTALPVYSEKYDCDVEPPFLPGQNCLCTAQSFTSNDETTYFLRRFMYKFVFPNGEFAQKCQVLEWDDAFTPDNGGPVEGTHHSFVCEGGETEIGPFECFERDTNGIATITNFETFCQLPCPDMSCPPCA